MRAAKEAKQENIQLRQIEKRSEQPQQAEVEAVQVVVRVRPSTALTAPHKTPSAPASSSSSLAATSHRPLKIIDDGRSIVAGGSQFHFDWVADEGASQADVYARLGDRLVRSALSGVDSCVLAYGQTGSGKTHTMLGALTALDHEQRGLLPRLLVALFAALAERAAHGVRAELAVSALEIYNERLVDLLVDGDASTSASSSSDTARLSVRERGDGVAVEGLSERGVSSAAEALAVLQRALGQRRSAATHSNAHSSRSHAICTARLTLVDAKSGVVTRARVHLVDLAGSERQKKSGTRGEQLVETAAINKSLLTLGAVMRARAEGSVHVPYRDSKLTHVLRDALEAAQATLIATVANDDAARNESLATLHFAQRATLVQTKPAVHVHRALANALVPPQPGNTNTWSRTLVDALEQLRSSARVLSAESTWAWRCALLSDAWLLESAASATGSDPSGASSLMARVESVAQAWAQREQEREAQVRSLRVELARVSEQREEALRVHELLAEESALDKAEAQRLTHALARATEELSALHTARNVDEQRSAHDAAHLRSRVEQLQEELATQAVTHAREQQELEARLSQAATRAQEATQREHERSVQLQCALDKAEEARATLDADLRDARARLHAALAERAHAVHVPPLSLPTSLPGSALASPMTSPRSLSSATSDSDDVAAVNPSSSSSASSSGLLRRGASVSSAATQEALVRAKNLQRELEQMRTQRERLEAALAEAREELRRERELSAALRSQTHQAQRSAGNAQRERVQQTQQQRHEQRLALELEEAKQRAADAETRAADVQRRSEGAEAAHTEERRRLARRLRALLDEGEREGEREGEGEEASSSSALMLLCDALATRSHERVFELTRAQRELARLRTNDNGQEKENQLRRAHSHALLKRPSDAHV